MSEYDKEPVGIDWIAPIVLMALLGNDKISKEEMLRMLEDMAKRNGISLDEKETNGGN